MDISLDSRVRTAAFTFLEAETRRAGSDVLPRTLLAQGFQFDGRRVPILGPQGIFKPAVLPDMPLSITTVPVEEGEVPPYRDVIGRDGLLHHCYSGPDPRHRDNVGLRLARQATIWTPRRPILKPNREFLEERYALFRRAS